MLDGAEKLQKRESRGWKQGEHVRDVGVPYDVYRAATNVVAAEKGS